MEDFGYVNDSLNMFKTTDLGIAQEIVASRNLKPISKNHRFKSN